LQAPAQPEARAPFDAHPESYRYFWEYARMDCYPGIELGNCADHPQPYSIQECKRKCLNTPNCGGFNLPNGHLKKLGCMEEMQNYTNLNLFVLNGARWEGAALPLPLVPSRSMQGLPKTDDGRGRPADDRAAPGRLEYAPQRNYWWRVKDFDCNPGTGRRPGGILDRHSRPCSPTPSEFT
jgi:hypothetical protein